MKTRVIATAIAIFVLCSVASAQSYVIRVTYNTNLRDTNSLTGGIVVTVSAGTTLQVVGSLGRWLRIARNGNEVWMADWVSYSRVESSDPAPSQVTQSEVDNCCFVDRQCTSDAEWTDGYYAYQNNQCNAPPPSQGQTSPQPATTVSSQINNCCFVNRQCNSDAEWTDGYYAFQNNQCAAPPQKSSLPAGMDESQIDNCCWVNRLCNTDLDWQRGHAAYKYYQCSTDIPIAIEGSPKFVREVIDAFNLLKEKVPRLYAYGISGLSKIREVPAGSVIGVYVESRTFEYAIDLVKNDEGSIIFLAGSILHEACHVHRWEAGLREVAWKEERACVEKDLEGVLVLDPEDRYGNAAWYRDLIANLHKPEYWWWADDD